MKICPKCKNKHQKSGVFCSYACSNSRKFSKASRQRKSDANKKYWADLTPEQKEQKSELFKQTMPGIKQRYLNSVLHEDWEFLSWESKRLRVIVEQHGKCNRCDLSTWLEQPITLEYEHKNGNNKDDRRENVEALCPNCHSQTPTWRGRKNGKKQKRVLEYLNIKITPA